MRWEELLFLHWPVDPDLVRPHLPDDLELDTFDGMAWIGVVPFIMAATRFRWLPPVPTANCFPECNVRTYVRHKHDSTHNGRPGVWFFSLDAQSRLAVTGARTGFGLPYFYADMSCQQSADRTHFKTRRRDRRGPPATFEATWRTTGKHQIAAESSFEYFLAERYCLYSQHRGRLTRGEIAHNPWQLAPIDLDLKTNDMTKLLNLQLSGPPISALAAQPLDVASWTPTS